MAVVDEISPPEYGEDRIVLALNAQTTSPRVLQPFLVDVDYSAADPEGVKLPLEFSVIAPSGAQTSLLTEFRQVIPSQLVFRPLEGGEHLVRLAERFHNKWFGFLLVQVLGDELNPGF